MALKKAICRRLELQEDVDMDATEETATLAEWDANEPAIYASLIVEIKREALKRINIRFPAIDDVDKLNLVKEQWLSIDPAARQATADFQYMIDVHQAAKDAIATVKTFTTQEEVDAYDVTTDPAWP